MKESISYTYLLNMMLVFIFIAFGVMLTIFSYTKAFRVNSKIASAIEEAEGYNELSKVSIDSIISNLGYQPVNGTCKTRTIGGVSVSAVSGTQGYCLYKVEDGDYYYYGITTYMIFDLPLINQLRFPIYNTTERMYRFE